MPDFKKIKNAAIVFAILLNAVLVFGIVWSVLSAFNTAKTISFTQNIENIRTLTNASANKIELEFFHHTHEIETIAEYINSYNGIGMYEDELVGFLNACYGMQSNYSWQLADNSVIDSETQNAGFCAYLPDSSDNVSFRYKVNAYPELAKIFCSADETTLGKVRYTSEFTDASPSLKKSAAITTTVRIRDENGGYNYKTLLLLIRSDYINVLLSNNNDIDTLSFFDYSDIIVDNDGNYVISNDRFQGTNFLKYIALYNDNFSDKDYDDILEKLHTEDYSDVLFYRDSRGKDCVYTLVPVQNSDWHILSIVPAASFSNDYDFSRSFLYFALPFIALFVLDIFLVLVINRKLRSMTKKAREANESKSLFLSSMSHDIRTPMNAIVGMTIIAEKQLDEENIDRESVRECIKSIEMSSGHLLTLINDVLDISKIESGKIVLHNADFSIAQTLCDVVEMCKPQINEKKFVFDVIIRDVLHEYVIGDALRVNQIFINILTNAVKYTEQGGKITVELFEDKTSSENAARYVYKVSDTGIGMSPEFTAAIFNRFSRAVDTRINSVQGTGLGMAIVKQLTDLMDGEVTVESEINVGSVFTVTLELPFVTQKADKDIHLEQISVLLISNDAFVCDAVRKAFLLFGTSVETADNVQLGTEAAETGIRSGKPYKIIFIDGKVPDVSEKEYISEIKRISHGQTSVIAITDCLCAKKSDCDFANSADYSVSKPLFGSKLMNAIKETMSGRKKSEKNDSDKESFPDMHILAVEDNDTNWKILDRILKYYSINAQRAENGKIAVEIMKNCDITPQLVLMDIQMPVMNGYESAKAIRALDDKERSSVPIYAMTADIFSDDVRRCREAGMDGHLSKPIDIEKVLEIIRMYYKPEGNI